MTLRYMAPAPLGNNGNNGLTPDTPWLTFAFSIPQLVAGDTLFLRGGTYNERVHALDFFLPTGTAWNNAITVEGYQNETATLLQIINMSGNVDESPIAYWIWNKFTFRVTGSECFRVATLASNIRLCNSDLQSFSPGEGIIAAANIVSLTGSFHEILNCVIHDAPVTNFTPTITTSNYGMYISPSDSLVEGCTIINNSGQGINHYLQGGSTSNNNIFRNNILYGNARNDGNRNLALHALTMGSGTNNFAYNNIIYNNKAGIQIVNNAPNNFVYNNTIYDNDFVGIEVFPDAPDTTVRNNIVYQNGGGSAGEQILNQGASGLISTNNLLTDPSFVNAVGGDFRLQSGSAAINAGVTITAVPFDFLGFTRPQGAAYDIGAYEFVEGSGGAHLIAQVTLSQQNGGTSTAINTTGATLLVIGINADGGASFPTVSDSKGNTWIGLTQQASSFIHSRIFYAENPIVGTGHTFTFTGTNVFSSMHVAAFGNILTTSPFDKQSGASGAAITSLQPGSILPAVNGELIYIYLGLDPGAGAVSINSGFLEIAEVPGQGGVFYGGVSACIIQTLAAAINPTWSWVSPSAATTVIASFRPSGGMVGGHGRLLGLQRNYRVRTF